MSNHVICPDCEGKMNLSMVCGDPWARCRDCDREWLVADLLRLAYERGKAEQWTTVVKDRPETLPAIGTRVVLGRQDSPPDDWDAIPVLFCSCKACLFEPGDMWTERPEVK